LKHYIENRATVIQAVAQTILPQPTWPPDWTTEGAAKVLFLTLGYGGAISTWCEEYCVPSDCLPAIVGDFEKEQRSLRAADAAAHPELLQRVRSAGKFRPEVSLQSALNLKTERERLDLMASRVPIHDSAALIGSFEHDGLFIWRPPSSEERPGWEFELRDKLNTHDDTTMSLSLKAIPSKEELLERLRTIDPDGDWDTIDERWDEQLNLILQARPGITRGREDRLYAEIVAHERSAYEDYPWPVRDLFKHDRAGTYWLFNPTVFKWEKDTEIGRNELLHVISTVLSRRLADYTTTIGEEGGEVLVKGSPPEVLNSAPLVERVEKMLRAPLKDSSFELDGEETRRFIQFTNGVFDRETLTFVQCNPEIRVTNTTEWAWEGSGLTAETELAITSALENVAADEARGEGLSKATCVELDNLCAILPDLKYIDGLCGTWERAIYCLKHIARATFALKYQDILVTRGPGGNGKDVLANRVATLLGTYFVNLACEALTSCRDLDSPSQTILGLRSKRFVCVREMAKNQTIRGHIYRTISDPKNKVKARGLYGKDQEFHPHYLLFACTNVPLDLDDKGGGSQRRTRILDMPFNYVDEPSAPNERMKDPNIEDDFERNNPSFFYLLIQILRILLSKPANHVAPVPDEVRDAGAEELEEPWEACLCEFVRKRMAPTEKPTQASTAAEVREEFFKAAAGGVPQREVRLKLAHKGFHETTQAVREGLKKTTRRVYQYSFGEEGTQYVKLQGE
jgi:hypothetical protein